VTENAPATTDRPRPLAGIRVVELGEDLGAYAGKLLADAGAEVILVEPPGGLLMRRYGPFLDDEPGLERSLYFAFYHTTKKSVTLDFESAAGREKLRGLIEGADVVVDGLGLGRLAALGVDYESTRTRNPKLIMLGLTAFGQSGLWAAYKTSDLVALALGGPLFDCGYDDHSIPPIRPSGNQAYNTVSHLSLIAVMTALIWRQKSGEGQFIDLPMHHSCATTIEFSNLYWFFNQVILMRQTCRHAAPFPSQPSHQMSADGRYVWGFMRFNDDKLWGSIKAWLDEKGLLLDLADPAYDDPDYRREHTGEIQDRIANLIAISPADEVYHRAQQLGMVIGIIRAPEDFPDDPHLKARGFFKTLESPAWDRPIQFPGTPYRFSALECGPSRPPLLAEHDADVFGALEAGATR
jgi:crotonobetainyl-CoA:carnitine CoA-transferase CaiB-like acyl-CoA transferase